MTPSQVHDHNTLLARKVVMGRLGGEHCALVCEKCHYVFAHLGVCNHECDEPYVCAGCRKDA